MGMVKVKYWLLRAFWWLQKKEDSQRNLTDRQAEMLVSYHSKSLEIFRSLGIDLDTKPNERRRLYHMMLLWLDGDEVICPAEARTASLIGFLDSLGSGWHLPPASTAVSAEFAEKIDGYMGMEVLRNTLGLAEIREELVAAIDAREIGKASGA